GHGQGSHQDHEDWAHGTASTWRGCQGYAGEAESGLCALIDQVGAGSMSGARGSAGAVDQLSIDDIDVLDEGSVFHGAIGQVQMARCANAGHDITTEV